MDEQLPAVLNHPFLTSKFTGPRGLSRPREHAQIRGSGAIFCYPAITNRMESRSITGIAVRCCRNWSRSIWC